MVRIDSTSFGEVVVDGKTYYSDVTVWWDGRTEFRDKTHIFSMEEFLKILEKRPDTIVVGTGQHGVVKVPDEVRQVAEEQKVDLFIENSPKAMKIFNSFITEGRKAVAVIHSTC